MSEAKLRSEAQFNSTFGASMLRLSRDEEPPFDFWSYFNRIPSSDSQVIDRQAALNTLT